MKRSAGTVDARPSKRLFRSVIADYDLDRSICELIDNAVDVRLQSKRQTKVTIKIGVDTRQQSICVEDDAGVTCRLSSDRRLLGDGHRRAVL
jgi:hypothetical protein